MSNHPLVSIITPTYCHERFIGECIASARAQTYEHWEQIIVDDGSPDGTWALVEAAAAADHRIRPFRLQHRGPARLAQVYNHALAQARGDYIAILEGDDYWLPDKLALQLQRFDAQTVFSYGAYFDAIEGQLLPGQRPPFAGRLSLQAFLPILLLHQSHMLAVTQLIRREALLDIGGFHQDESPAAVDMATLLRLARLPGNVVYLSQPLGVWRHHSAQSTSLRAIELAQCNSRLALRCYDQMNTIERQATGVLRDAIVHARRKQIADAYFGVLRETLRRRERAGAAALIMGTWQYGTLKRKLEAVYAIGALAFKRDFEPVLRLAQRLGFA